MFLSAALILTDWPGEMILLNGGDCAQIESGGGGGGMMELSELHYLSKLL